MSATEYTVHLRDIRFVLFEQMAVQDTLKGIPAYADFDQDTYETMLQAAADMATGTLWPINRAGDRAGCSLDGEGNVTTPPGYKEAYRAVAEAGLISTAMKPEFGGIGLPHAVDAAMGEMLTGACVAFSIYTGLSRAAANVLTQDYTPAWIRDAAVAKLATGEWSGTMCLTEAGAGSAVGDNRAKAVPVAGEEGKYTLTGEKIFISGGDNDMTSNVIHLVLARAPDAPAGTKGLSIFMVPKFLFDADGNAGARNGAKVLGIEHKMGINGSATCTVGLGTDEGIPCYGWRLGAEGQGMAIMFGMMNEARIGVGVQAVSTASAAYFNALAYTKDRVQGSAVEAFREADPPRLTINKHPDVRRMLMTMKCQIEALRSLIYSVANRLDRAENGDPAEKEYLLGLVELMTPIVKSHGSDLGFELCCTALQCFGGYGFTQEYPVEQFVRDSKINSIYEGANGIQAMDLLGRKMRTGNGKLFMMWLDECNKELEAARSTGKLNEEVTALEKARDQLGQTAMHLGALGMQGNLRGAMLQSSSFLTMFGTVVLGLHSLWQARVAQQIVDGGNAGAEDASFYKGKILNAKFYMKNILPKATALGKAIQNSDESCLDEGLFD